MYIISADTTQLQAMMDAVKNLKPAQVERVFIRAINRTASMARTEIVRRIKEAVNIRTTAIRDRVRLYEARTIEQGAGISISHKRISLIEFQARQIHKRGGGVKYQIGKWGIGDFAPSAFITEGTGAVEGVFIRRRANWLELKHVIPSLFGKKFKQYDDAKDPETSVNERFVGQVNRVGRNPIDLLRGPSLWRIFTGWENLVEDVVEDSKKRLNKHVWDQIDLIASGVRYAPNKSA